MVFYLASWRSRRSPLLRCGLRHDWSCQSQGSQGDGERQELRPHQVLHLVRVWDLCWGWFHAVSFSKFIDDAFILWQFIAEDSVCPFRLAWVLDGNHFCCSSRRLTRLAWTAASGMATGHISILAPPARPSTRGPPKRKSRSRLTLFPRRRPWIILGVSTLVSTFLCSRQYFLCLLTSKRRRQGYFVLQEIRGPY